MKTAVLKLLEDRLSSVKKSISEYEDSLKTAKANPHQFSEDSFQTLRSRLSDYNQQKREIVSCIAWVKSIEKKEVRSA